MSADSTAEVCPADTGKTADNSEILQSDSDEKTKCRPFVKWAGGKTQLLPELLKRMPQHFFSYFEPMAGGAALFFKTQPKRSSLGEINPDLYNAYRVIKSDVNELIEDLRKHVYDPDYYYATRNIDRSEEYKDWSDIQKASRFIYLNKTCYNGLYRVNSKGQFNTPFGEYKNPTIADEVNLHACSKALQNTFISGKSFENVLEETRSGDFVYFDPPYAPLSKTASFTAYVKDGFPEEKQRQLQETCIQLDKKGVKFMLSNSNAELIRELYSPFNIEEVGALRAINSRGQKRGRIKELIIRNYQ